MGVAIILLSAHAFKPTLTLTHSHLEPGGRGSAPLRTSESPLAKILLRVFYPSEAAQRPVEGAEPPASLAQNSGSATATNYILAHSPNLWMHVVFCLIIHFERYKH